MNKFLLPEFDQEMANTRKTLERIPQDKLGWAPHERSWSMAELATHIANLPNWAVMTMKEDQLDMNPPEGQAPPSPPRAESREELIRTFDKNVADARSAIAGSNDEQFMAPWTLLSGGKTVFTMPRAAVLRSFVINHIIHHRAQLGVYFRLSGVPVPALYGPSADEGSM